MISRRGEEVVLRELTCDDVGPRYLTWMNDSQVNQYLETRWSEHDLEGIRSFVEAKLNSENEFLLGIFWNDCHVGNIKLGPVRVPHMRCDISYFIGDKEVWGKGVASHAIGLALEMAFETLGMEKVCAGCYATNQASIRVLARNGFRQEGHRSSHVVLDGKREDVFEFGLLKSDWDKLVKNV